MNTRLRDFTKGCAPQPAERSNQAMQLTASKPAIYAGGVCRRERMLRSMHRGLAPADLVSRSIMKRTAIVAAASLMICVAPVIRASQDPAPPVTPETINGLWEAFSKDDTRVFRLELDAGRGWLAVGIPFIDPMTFALTDTRWQQGGVELYFRGVGRSSRGAGGPDDPTPYTAVLRLRGVAWKIPEIRQEGGHLTGVFVLSPDRPNPSRWKLSFQKSTAIPYLDTISKLSEQAKEANERQRQTGE